MRVSTYGALVLTRYPTSELPDLFAGAKARGARLLTFGVNQLAQQQPWATDLLSTQAGKTFQIHWREVAVMLTIGDTGHLTTAAASATPDVDIYLDDSLAELMSRPLQATEQALPLNIRVSGDAALAQTLSMLARDLRPDIEDGLAKRVGDIPAARITQAVRQTVNTVQSSLLNLGQNVIEYLTYETQALVDKGSVLTFAESMAALSAQLNELSARETLLNARVEQLMLRRDRPAS